MNKLGLEPLKSDPCHYSDQRREIIVIVYVDDGMIITHTKEKCLNLLKSMNTHFTTKRVNGNIFLGIQIEKNKDYTTLTQNTYLLDILEKFNQLDSKSISSPNFDMKYLSGSDNSNKTNAPYREVIGSLLYLALNTRPVLDKMVYCNSQRITSHTEKELQ